MDWQALYNRVMGEFGPRPEGKVNREWSSRLAYAIGLLASDGNLSKDGRHIDFTSKDRDLVVTFSECLGINNKIGRKTSGYTGRKDYFRVQFGDVLFYGWLRGIGLGPNKSKTLRALRVPDKYFLDFLRGCFDGDGSIYAYWDLRWRSSYMFYSTFASASKPFIEWLRLKIGKLVKVEGKIHSGGNKVLQLRFAKEGTRALFNRMFYSDNVPHLQRKFAKAREIFKIDDARSR